MARVPVCRAGIYYELPLLACLPVCRARYHLLCVGGQLIVSIQAFRITIKMLYFKVPHGRFLGGNSNPVISWFPLGLSVLGRNKFLFQSST